MGQPVGSPPPASVPLNLPSVKNQTERAWYRGGNVSGGAAGANNIFGTGSGFNSDIFTQTNGRKRTRLNGDLISLIQGVNQNVSGYLGLSFNPAAASVFDIESPRTMLHLDGPNNTPFGGDWRSWMRTGTYYRENSDAMYVGLKPEAGTNRSDAVVNWSDDPFSGGGPDALRFIFTSTSNSGNGTGTNPLSSSSLNGYEYMRMTPFPAIANSTGLPIGHIGIGPLFNNTQLPQNRLHINAEDALPNYLQVTNQTSTGQTANDGFHFGITGGGIAEVKQKENLDMRFFTNNIPQAVIKNTGLIGFNTNTPNNELEITSRATTPYGLSGSGLRFTNMTSANTPIANPGLGVLSVDANGDVIYVPGTGIATANNGISVNAGVVQLGVPCTLPGGFPNISGILASQYTADRVVANRNFNFWIASLDAETGGVGIGGQPVLPFCGTGNTFEVSANSKNTKYGSIAASGVRFTKLLSTSPTIPNGTFGVNSAKVLTVDQDGDVVLTDAFTGNTLGNLCGATQNPITNNYQIPMDGFNFNYTTPANTQSSFHLGNTVCVPTLGRMNVYNDNLQITSAISSNVSLATNAIGVISNITNTGTGNSLSMQGTANTNGTGSTARGLRGEAIASNGSLAEGVKGIATSNNNCLQNIAVGGLAANGAIASISGDFDVENSNSGFNQGINVEVKLGTNAAAINFGINTGVNTPASVNYGGYFAAAGATNNYGVYGQAPHSGGTNGPNYAGYFDGDLVYTGTFGMASDATLKTNIDTLQDAISVINQLKPKQFNFDQAGHPSMSFPNGLQYGLIAQDVETVLPNLVNNNVHPAKLDSIGNVVVPPVNFKSVEYEQLIPFLIKGMQQQQAQIKKQDSLITALSNQINACCSNTTATRQSNSNINQLDIELSDKDAIVLNQNVPNPFAEQTTITYNVPASVGKAQLIFFNTNGQVIQTVDIKTRGKGKVNVFASDLSSGLYNYTLVADGKVIDSKKMVRE